MRGESSVLHLDLDAFYASVEQRDKPSLRGKPVIVGGVGPRGVVATASYEARVYGVKSAMATSEARRRCAHAAFLAPRFDVYRAASEQVMRLLRELSPLVEPLSLDEAFVDLRAANRPVELTTSGVQGVLSWLKTEVAARTGGLTASVGAASSKFLAKIASELGKPDGLTIVEPGTEVERLRPMPVGVIFGVGPVTQERLSRIGVRTVADLQRVSADELATVIGPTHARALTELAFARDDRPVEPERETKSISVEDTFAVDVVDPAELVRIIDRDADLVAARLRAAGLFARTVTIKARQHDFVTNTRARTLASATDRGSVIAAVARSLLGTLDTTGGLRLLGVGVAGLTELVQDDLFAADEAETAAVTQDGTGSAHGASEATPGMPAGLLAPRHAGGWSPGADVVHDALGRGWVWGAGIGRVTVRFETAGSPPGPVRTFPVDDPALRLLEG